jgi:hypothetical protein
LADLIHHADDQWRVRRPGLPRPLLDRGLRWLPLFFQNSWIPATEAGMMSGTSAKDSSSSTTLSGPALSHVLPLTVRQGYRLDLAVCPRR